MGAEIAALGGLFGITSALALVATLFAAWMAWRIVEKAGLPGWVGLGAVLITLTGVGSIVPLILLWVFAYMRWPRDEVERELGFTSGCFRIGATGRLVQGKGFIDLLNAFADFQKSAGNTELLLIGGNIAQDIFPFQRQFLARVKELGLEQRVVVTGVTDCVEKHLATCDIFVLPSYREGVPRSLIEAAAKIGELGYTEDRDIEQVLDEAQSTIYTVANAPSLREFSAMKDELKEAWERLEKLQKHEGAMRGVPTGFAQLDNMLSGFQKSDLIILAARPSMGKTALALDIARQTAIKYGTAVGIFSLEMDSQQLVDRMLAAQAGVDAWKLRTGRKFDNEGDYESLQDAMSALSEAPIYIDDKPSATVLTMRSVARRLKSERGLGLIIIDYLQLITPSTAGSNVSAVQQVTEISRALKAMARELEVPVIALSQLSRAVEQRGGRPRLSDLRDSGSIEQDADVVMFIHREDMMGNRAENEKNNVAEVLIEKHRNGPIGKVELMFDDKKTRFCTLENNDFADFSGETKVEESAPF